MDLRKATRAEIAVDLAERYHFQLIPCKPNSKEPAINGGVKSATADPAMLRSWFETLTTKDGKPNIGIACGRASGIVVVDIDPKNDDDAFLNASELCGYDDLWEPDTVIVDTPSGGQHWYFLAPGFAVRNHTNIVAGVDIKASNGYVISAGCTIGDKRYDYSREGDIAPLPSALLQRLRAAKAPTSNDDALSWNDVRGVAVAKGGRNDALTKLAGRLWNSGCRTAELYAALLERNKLYKPPLHDSEVRNIVASAERNFHRKDKTPTIDYLGPDIAAIAPPPPQVIIPEILPCASTIFAGAGHEGKSVSLLFMAIRIALGQPIFGRDTREGTVLYVFGEDSTDDVRRLVHLICYNDPELRGHGKSLHERLHLLNAAKTGGGLLLEVSGSWRPGRWFDWIDTIVAGKGYSVVILDTLSSLGLPESSGMNDAAAAYHLEANRIAEAHGLAFVGSHHVGQRAAQEREIGMYTARGATAITDNARCVIQVQRHTKGDPYPCPVDIAGRHVVRWHVVKHKWSSLTKDTPLWLIGDKYHCQDYRELTGSRRAEAERKAVIERLDARTEQRYDKIEAALDLCEKKGVPASKDNIVQFIDGLGVNLTKQTVNQMASIGLLVGEEVRINGRGRPVSVYRRKRYREQ